MINPNREQLQLDVLECGCAINNFGELHQECNAHKQSDFMN